MARLYMVSSSSKYASALSRMSCLSSSCPSFLSVLRAWRYVAKPSFSHRCDQRFAVARSPNHMSASSCFAARLVPRDEPPVGDDDVALGNCDEGLGGGFVVRVVVARIPIPRELGLTLRPRLDGLLWELVVRGDEVDTLPRLRGVFHPK